LVLLYTLISMAKTAFNILEYCYFRDQIIPFANAQISIMNHSFMYGSAVFEGIRAYYNQDDKALYLLHAQEHLQRILNSAKILRLQANKSVQEMIDIVVEVLKKNAPQQDTYIRPSWFKDTIRIGPSVYCEDDQDSFVVSCITLGDYVDTKKGLNVRTSSWRRLADTAIPARAKVNGSYVNTGLAKAEAILSGYDDAIFLNDDGHVAEGSAMNLFMVTNGTLVSSMGSENILEGITRNFITTIALEELGLQVVYRSIDRTELYTADELFFCGTGAQVAPVTNVDNYVIADAKPGAITTKIQDLYSQICHGKIDKYKKYLIKIEI
jgi:branched-chain amino acid aminotransferase